MTEEWTGDAQPPRRSRVLLLTGVAGAVVVLAAVGATGGWLLAGSKDDNHAGPRSPTPTWSPTPAPSPAVSTQPTTTEPAEADFVLPDLTGADFVAARRTLRDRNLGVVVIFGGSGEDRTVDSTDPAPGTVVHPGITVKLHVNGPAPELTAPRLVGMGCAAAGRQAAEQGLNPRYDPKKAGTVLRQDPEPSAVARWNDSITLSCA